MIIMEPDKINKAEQLLGTDEVLGVGIVTDLEGAGVKRVEIVRRRDAPKIQPELPAIDRGRARNHKLFDHGHFARYIAENGHPEVTAIFCDPNNAIAIAALADGAELDSELIRYEPMATQALALVDSIRGQKLSPKAFSKLCRRLIPMAASDGVAAELRLLAGQLSVTKEAKEATGSGVGSVHGRMVKIEVRGGTEQTVSVPDTIALKLRPYLDSSEDVDVDIFVDLYANEQGIVFEIDTTDLATITTEHFRSVIDSLRSDLPGFYVGLGSLELRDWRVVR